MRDLTFEMTQSLQVRDLVIRRNGQALLDVTELTLDGPGPTLLLGPNGAGKSLLLRCLHGLIIPDRGTVRQGGEVMSEELRSSQAMVFQRPVLLRRSVAGNLDFVLRRQGMARAARKDACQALLAQGGLAGKARQSARSCVVSFPARVKRCGSPASVRWDWWCSIPISPWPASVVPPQAKR